ncbi:MAG TPA: hypothetical protein VEL47_01675 [Myxococcota bacterium]|nr:hypothetical protein [Myxococcota bacterium]
MTTFNFFKKLSNLLLPKEIDFFGNLYRQSSLTEEVLATLHNIYFKKSKTVDQLDDIISRAYQLRKRFLLELNVVLITPIDREAISRTYLSLDWIVLSVKHFNAEINTYNIAPLERYEKIFISLIQQMTIITQCFLQLKEKKYDEILEALALVISMDDDLISEYSYQLKILFESDVLKDILAQREILSQLKEISKHIHVCANTVEDIVFKMH